MMWPQKISPNLINMENKTNGIGHIALNRYKNSVGDSLLLSLTFFLLFGSCFALILIGIDLSLLGVLLIGLPALLSMQLMVLRPKKEDGPTTKEGFLGFRLYFTFYFGVYRFWLSLVKALLVLILAALVSSFTLFYIFNACSLPFREAFSSFSYLATQSETTVQKLYEALSSSQPLMSYCSWVAVISLLFAGYYFFHEIGKNTFNTYVRSFIGAVPSRAANAIFSDFFRQERLSFYKDYYKANWPAIILFVIGYAGGAAFGMFLFASPSYAISFAFIGACLLLSPYLPYFFYVMDEMAKRREKSLISYSLRQAEAALEQTPLGDANQQETRESIQKYIDELKKKVEDEEAKEKENGEDNSSPDDKEKPSGN